MGIGVLLMRPFAKRELLSLNVERAVLDDLGVASWTHALLAWGLGHPAVSATIPATSKPERASDNAAAGDIVLSVDQREVISRLVQP
jgi:diketogulonate reductase-like aldo/keto reductase